MTVVESEIGYAICNKEGEYKCNAGYYLWHHDIRRAKVYLTREEAQKKATEICKNYTIVMVRISALAGGEK